MFKVGTVVCTANGSKGDVCISLGADEVIDYRSVDFADALKGRRFDDACVDCSGETAKMPGLVKENGALVTILTHNTSEMLREWLGSVGPQPGFAFPAIASGGIKYIPAPILNLFREIPW